MEALNQAIVVASTPPDQASEDSPLSSVVFDASQQLQAGMEDLLKTITEIDTRSTEVTEEIEKCKENAFQRRKFIEEEKDRFQKAAFAVLDMLNTGDGKPGLYVTADAARDWPQVLKTLIACTLPLYTVTVLVVFVWLWFTMHRTYYHFS